MKIELVKQIDETTKEVYVFNIFDLNVVFTGWHIEVKPKGKRKWTIEKFWDKYARANTYNMSPEPELTEILRSEALSEVFKIIKVLTWNEYKKWS